MNVDKKQRLSLSDEGNLADSVIDDERAVGRHLLCCLTDVKWIPVTKIMDRLRFVSLMAYPSKIRTDSFPELNTKMTAH